MLKLLHFYVFLPVSFLLMHKLLLCAGKCPENNEPMGAKVNGAGCRISIGYRIVKTIVRIVFSDFDIGYQSTYSSHNSIQLIFMPCFIHIILTQDTELFSYSGSFFQIVFTSVLIDT